MGSPLLVPTQPQQAAQTRAQWFKHSLFWQEQHKRKKALRVTNYPTTPPLSYDRKVKIGSLNVQGFADTLKLKNSIQLMQEHNLDILFLSETRATSYYSYLSENFLVVLSGNTREKFAGVGAIIAPHFRPHLLDIIQLNSRIIQISCKKQGGNLHFIGVYAPHSGLDHDTVREPFWDQLESHINNIPAPEPVYITGDFNVRFQASHKNDEGVTGKFTYGKGARFIDHNATSNRSLCVRTMSRLGMIEAASHITQNPIDHITYRDKAAPPSDWSQFVLDPIPLQQIYSVMHHKLSSFALEGAALVRSFLDLPELLQPPKSIPHIDPTRFQRLDHLFTRKQWLNSVHKCRSRLYTGFPSDHFLLVSEIQVRLAARSPKPPQRPRLDLNKVLPEQKLQFNQILQELLEEPTEASQTTTPVTSKPPIHFYTDGSGSRGKCSSSTPAGWGWCFRQGDNWTKACGPVVTQADHNAYRGAQVGSNNTGELTAIIEALLYAHQHDHTEVHIHSDSRWAINVILGRWRPQRHKSLVNYARNLLRINGRKASLHWIKAHAGHEGNELADTLANSGKISTQRQGTNAQLPEHPAALPTTTSEDRFRLAAEEAAKQTFHPKTYNRSKPWITNATLQALSEARTAEAQQDHNAKQLRNKAKRMARKDRVNWIHQALLRDPRAENPTVWKTVRSQKRGFQGRKNHLVVGNKPVPWSQTHQAFRDHLQNTQWAKTTVPLPANPHTHQINPQLSDHSAFSQEELQEALRKLKDNKAPGPDQVPNEIFKLLDHNAELILLKAYNDIWTKGEVPNDWKEATVVSIYKGKGADTDPANYRPISLLNTIYKIFAAMLQTRLAKHHDQHLRKTQYGFRAHRGTQSPLHILRRSMEWSEMTNTPLHLLFLDWKQAFDSLDHNAMITALKRFGLSQPALNIISSIYQDPIFYTRGPMGDSCKGYVGSGIRQGCPLSPYLFIIVLTVMLDDVDYDLASKGVATNTWSAGKPIFDLEYADDTLLMALTTTQLSSIFTSLETTAQYYGMSLNQTKTELLTHPSRSHSPIRFADGTAVPTTTQVKYLGSMVSWIKPFETAFFHRTALAEAAYKKLRLVWNSSLARRTKLRIYQSVFIPTLIYGLDSLTLTEKHLKRIDAFYLRFLRRIVGIKASYYSHITNHSVWRTAGYPRKPSDQLNQSQRKLLNQLFLANTEDPSHHVVFSSAFRDRIRVKGRRRGMQFPYWLETTTQRFYREHWTRNPGRGILGPHVVYAEINKSIKRDQKISETAPKRAQT